MSRYPWAVMVPAGVPVAVPVVVDPEAPGDPEAVPVPGAADDPARLAASAAEHADIADAVGSGAADLAEATTRVHLHHAFHHLTRRGRAEETPTLLTPTEGDRP